MARAHYFQQLAGRLSASILLTPLSGATVNLYQQGTSTPITETIYASSAGGSTLTNPLTADSAGRIEFYLARAKRIDLVVSAPNYDGQRVTVDVGDVKLIEYDIDDFGDVAGDGSGDDTAVLAAVFAACDTAGGGTVISGYPAHKLTSTLVAGSGSFKTINLRGQGMLATRLWWYGPTTDPAIRINGLKQYLWEGFLLENKVAKGTTVGVLVRRDSGTGTQSGSCLWRNIRITDFAKGVQVGNSGISQAGSEMHFDNLMLERNDIGAQIQDGNSLNFLFTMLEMGANGTGLQVVSGGVVAVVGGSASGQTVADFDFQPGGSYSISTFRSEHANRFVIGGNTTAGTAIHLSGNTVTTIDNVDGYGIRVASGPIVLIGNDFKCKLTVGGTAHSSVSAIGNAIADTVPVDFSTLGGTGGRYHFLGNRQVDINNFNVGPFDDEAGDIVAGVRVPSMKIKPGNALQVRAFTTATLPTASTCPGAIAYVSDGASGSKFQASDGTSWVSLG